LGTILVNTPLKIQVYQSTILKEYVNDILKDFVDFGHTGDFFLEKNE